MISEAARTQFKFAIEKRKQDWWEYCQEDFPDDPDGSQMYYYGQTPAMKHARRDIHVYKQVIYDNDANLLDQSDFVSFLFNQRIENWVDDTDLGNIKIIRPKTTEEKKDYLLYCLTKKVSPEWWKIAEDYIKEHPECWPDGA